MGRFLSLFCLIGVSTYIYLEKTNYFFDRKLEKMANPLLRELIINGIYRIPEEKTCSQDSYKITFQFSEVIYELMKENNNIPVTRIQINDCPGTAMRINDNKETALVFYNTKEIKCDLDNRYKVILDSYELLKKMFDIDKNSRYYAFYTNQNCTNQHIFEENAIKYKDQIFRINIKEVPKEIGRGNTNMFKYGNYYYMLTLINGTQPHYRDLKKEKYFIWKKLTLDELMLYDNGSYWKLIKDYNIKIDY